VRYVRVELHNFAGGHSRITTVRSRGGVTPGSVNATGRALRRVAATPLRDCVFPSSKRDRLRWRPHSVQGEFLSVLLG
jgi:hypothetical protein